MYRISEQHVEFVLYMTSLTVPSNTFVTIAGDAITQIQEKICSLIGNVKSNAIWFPSEANLWYIQNDQIIRGSASVALSGRYQVNWFYL